MYAACGHGISQTRIITFGKILYSFDPAYSLSENYYVGI